MPKVNWDNAPEELKELMCEMTSMIGKYEEYAEREVYERFMKFISFGMDRIKCMIWKSNRSNND